MRGRHLGYPLLALVLVLATAAGAMGVLPSWIVAIAIYGVPGFLICELLLNGMVMDRVERAILAVTLSLAVIVIGAQVLNLLPIGVTPLGWVLLLGGTSFAAAGALVWIGRDVGPWRPVSRWRGIARVDALRLAAAALLSVTAIAIAILAAGVRTDAGFTQLWIDRSADSALISVRSQETDAGSYRVVISTEPEEYTFTLSPGETWSLPIQVPDGAQEIDVHLYHGEGELPYRRLRVEL
jgi:hypothetical protein